MLKKRFFDILIIFSLISIVGMYVANKYKLNKKVEMKPKAGITRATDILRKKTTIPDSIINTTVTSSACTLFLKHSAELSMIDYANEFIDHTVDNILKTCAGAFPTVVQQKLDAAFLACRQSSREDLKSACYTALLDAKTSIVAAIIKPEADPKQLDSSILLHLLASKFFSGEFLEQPIKSLTLVDSLIEKEPNYYSGHKLKLALLSMSSLNLRENYEDFLPIS